MSPTAVYPESVNSAPIQSKGPALVIGSLATAQDGKYQSLIGSLEGNRQVDRQVLDRLMDGGGSRFHTGRRLMLIFSASSCNVNAVSVLVRARHPIYIRVSNSPAEHLRPSVATVFWPYAIGNTASPQFIIRTPKPPFRTHPGRLQSSVCPTHR